MDNLNAADGDVGIIDLTDDTDDETSNSGISEPSDSNLQQASEPLVLKLHHIEKEGGGVADPVTVKKRKKRRPQTEADDSSNAASVLSEQTSKEQFYDARESYHVMTGLNKPGITPSLPIRIEEVKDPQDVPTVLGVPKQASTTTVETFQSAMNMVKSF